LLCGFWESASVPGPLGWFSPFAVLSAALIAALTANLSVMRHRWLEFPFCSWGL
jgi:hypothetical protein